MSVCLKKWKAAGKEREGGVPDMRNNVIWKKGGRGMASEALGDHELALLVGEKAPCGLALGGEFVKGIDYWCKDSWPADV